MRKTLSKRTNNTMRSLLKRMLRKQQMRNASKINNKINNNKGHDPEEGAFTAPLLLMMFSGEVSGQTLFIIRIFRYTIHEGCRKSEFRATNLSEGSSCIIGFFGASC